MMPWFWEWAAWNEPQSYVSQVWIGAQITIAIIPVFLVYCLAMSKKK
jgi:hypothetical protein